ncbi:tetratricopeptide repeat protein [Streptomyces sp. NPDC057020]|uniref:tetratricopeptide repeat protein n=1 Tax=unclassified Streptomyces TaxID=2593676 RepID=UPI0036279458
MALARKPNERLAALLDEARWSNEDLARHVRRVGAEMGERFNYDSSGVTHWKRDGTMPRKAARVAIAEAFSRRLGRPVTLADVGMGPDSGTAVEADTVSGLVDLGSADMDPSRRGVLGAGLYSAALAVPGWPDAGARFDRVITNPHVRIGHNDVAAVRAMTEHISDLDDQFGGRMARPLAAAFMVNTIAPYLKATAPDGVKEAMLSAASDHLYLTGYMAMDERADGLAQRYYVKALELAGAAGDHLTYCTTLRGMSVQAVDLGHGSQAVRLASSASAAAPEAGPRMRAFLAGQQAHAAAQTGDRSGALLWIKEAEVAMERAESQAKAFGSYDPSSLAYHVGQVRYELGDVAGSVESLELADRLREPVYRRTRVRYNAMLAERLLMVGRLEEAALRWHAVLDDYPHVQSGRCDDRFRVMMSSLRPYLRNGQARELHDRARPMAPVAA